MVRSSRSACEPSRARSKLDGEEGCESRTAAKRGSNLGRSLESSAAVTPAVHLEHGSTPENGDGGATRGWGGGAKGGGQRGHEQDRKHNAQPNVDWRCPVEMPVSTAVVVIELNVGDSVQAHNHVGSCRIS